MGAYAEYMGRLQSLEDLAKERKAMLSRISKIRGGRDIMVFASDLSASRAPIGIDYTDILAVQDKLANMTGDSIDIVLETPGGLGEVVEDIVKLVREKYESVGMIIPGYAKSAGAIFAMAGDEILMDRTSSLGPIDAQLQLANGKRFSADAFLEGLEKIQAEAEKSGRLTPAYIPILQNISPGEIQNCKNIQAFSQHLVTKWLAEYKFKFWDRHSDGSKVTVDERRRRACEIATALCSQSKWLTHNRSIKVDDLKELRVKVTNYDDNADLSDAITRYYTLLRLSFEVSASYKIFETPSSQIYRFLVPGQAARPQARPAGEKSLVEVVCTKCQARFKVQVNWKKGVKNDPDAVPYNDSVVCPTCDARNPLGVCSYRLRASRGKRRSSSMRERHEADFEYVDGTIRPRYGRQPFVDGGVAGGRTSHPVPGGSMDRYFDADVLAETRLQIGRMAETVRLSSEIKGLADAVLSLPPKVRTVSGV